MGHDKLLEHSFRQPPARGMVVGMATTKVTITLDDGDLRKIRDLVASGRVASVSGFVKHAVAVALHDMAGWGVLLADALEQTGGPLTKQERAWADGILAAPAHARGKRRGKAA
jgi:Arc/MetJ-type ribon-helix-helix transcriptional regulator